jgi:SAM-dependent methyltransferase
MDIVNNDSSQHVLDRRNAEFWNELCGTGLAQAIGITDGSPESLRHFDDAYFGMYPYLMNYVTPHALDGKKVLEIGLGYGTLGQRLAERGAEYHGLDIAPGPVMMMRYRLGLLGRPPHVLEGSALDMPYEPETFDYVYSIGCLHHTGNLQKAIDEVHRILKPGGRTIVMLYNRNSFRQFKQVTLPRWRERLKGRHKETEAEKIRALYDTSSTGTVAPHTDYVTPREVRRLFADFSRVQIDIQNFDAFYLPYRIMFVPREKCLNNIGRVLGLDLYITATKHKAS